MKVFKSVTFFVKWRLPYSEKVIEDEYIIPLPKCVTASFYKWLGGKRKVPYKTNCLLERFKKLKR